MKYDELIKLDKQFQTSINLNFDLNDIEKIKSYIPTTKSVDILDGYLRAVYNQKSAMRASVLIGPYGRGKSHLVLVLLSIISLDDCYEDVIEELIEKIEQVNADTAGLARQVRNDFRLLPVVIDSSHEDLTQAMIVGLHEALSKIDHIELMPDTYFDAAFNIIRKWENEFPETIAAFTKELQNYKITYDELKMGLSRCQRKTYTVFTECFSKVTSGTIFNPMVNTSIIKIYQSINEQLYKNNIANGLYLVFDEFGKFLENNVNETHSYDFKLIQDLAELATRSDENQFHFTCITHKQIQEYSQTETFSTISARFSNVFFVASSEQSYELVANAIRKEDAYQDFFDNENNSFVSIADMISAIGIFDDFDKDLFWRLLVHDCFPLNPITTYCLLRVSEKVAQNERTFFTFIAQDAPYTVSRFLGIDHKGVDLIAPDYLYDYFENEFAKHGYKDHRIFEMWSKANNALKSAETEIQCKIIKTIAIIGIINDDVLHPVSTHIKAALLVSDDEFEKEIAELEKKRILYHQAYNSYYVFLTANGIDVNKYIKDKLATEVIKYDKCETLESINSLGYILPRRYNDIYCMIRYFKKIYIEEDQLLSYENGAQILDRYKYDGVLLYVIIKNEEKIAKIREASNRFIGYPNIIICIHDEVIDCDDLLDKYVAVQELKKEVFIQHDDYFMDELELFEEDFIKSISNLINTAFAPNNSKTRFYNCNGELKNIKTLTQLNREVSNICLDFYRETPVINNELINKNSITAPIRRARRLLVELILNSSEEAEIKEPKGNGPEVSIFKSLLTQKGLDGINESNDERLNAVLEIINGFISESELHKIGFNVIYDRLQDSPISMRAGAIPIYIAYVLRNYKSRIVIYNGDKEVDLAPELMNRISDAPEDYSIQTIGGTAENNRYLIELSELFADDMPVYNRNLSRINNLVLTMQGWMRSFPNYVKSHTIMYERNGEVGVLDRNVQRFRQELLKFEINPREFLFEQIPSMVGDDLADCYRFVGDAVHIFDTCMDNLKAYLSQITKNMLMKGYEGQLSEALRLWHNKLSEKTRIHSFDENTNKLLKYCESLETSDNESIINKLAYIFTRFGIGDWFDDYVNKYIDGLKKALEEVSDFENGNEENDTGDCQIVIRTNNDSIDTSFAETEIDGIGQTALNQIESIFEEYEGILDTNTKLGIVMKLLKNMIE